MTKQNRKSIAHALLAATAVTAFAGSALAAAASKEAKVEWVSVDRNGNGYIQFDVDVSTMNCGGSLNRVAFESGSAAGQAIHSTALAAKLSGTKVYVGGTGTCNDAKKAENVHYLTIM